MPSDLSRITRIQDLRVGDIFLGPIGGAVGLGVGLGEFLIDGGFRMGTIDVRHAGIVVTALPGTRYYDPDYPDGITDTFELAQAMPNGAEIVTMTYDKHWTSRCLYARLPEDYPGQAMIAAEVARTMVKAGVAYSFGSYASLALHRWTGGWPSLDRWIARRQGVPAQKWTGATLPPQSVTELGIPVEAICSVFVDQAWTLAGKQVMTGVKPQTVTPSQLATSLLSRLDDQDGTIIGFPGLHPYAAGL